MQKRAEKVLDMCLHPENFQMSSLCCELVDQKPDLNSNREKIRADTREAIAEIALEIISEQIGKIDLAVVEKHELQAFTDYLRKELGDYSKEEMMITYQTENSAAVSEKVAETSKKPEIRNDYNSPEL